MKWQARANEIIPNVIKDYPKSRFIFLTLTVRNCELDELKTTLSWMHKAWRKLTQRKEFHLVQGWVRSVEVTRGADDTVHPHYHCLLMVKPSYFSSGYVSQNDWTETWQSCLDVMYTPIVDVRSVRPGKSEKATKDVLMTSAICETLKYTVKPSDIYRDDTGRKYTKEQWLTGLTSQLYKVPKVATGGILKQYLKELEREPDDLIHIDEDKKSQEGELPRVGFCWEVPSRHYSMLDAETAPV